MLEIFKERLCADCGYKFIVTLPIEDCDAYCDSCKEHHYFCRHCGEELFEDYYINEGYCKDCL